VTGPDKVDPAGRDKVGLAGPDQLVGPDQVVGPNQLSPAADFAVRPIGWVRSSLTDRANAPRQGDEGGPQAWIEFAPEVSVALDGLDVGVHVILLTWLDRADRTVLAVHPRGDATRARQGVFATRSPDRPNPIGLHRVPILAVEGNRVQVGDLEALDGTPVLDVKPVLGGIAER
jgi:tRNA-Thr(GGU) m(6)t(6)A37 methyltransferase TsaA